MSDRDELVPRAIAGRKGWATVALLATFLAPASALAAPEAHILRIDPRASVDNNTPVLTTVVELVQHKRMSDLTAPCASFTGNEELDCLSEKLEKQRSLYEPFAFPQENAFFTVTVDGADMPTTFVSKAKWGDEKKTTKGVGTAWLIVIDASGDMGNRFDEAREVARAFTEQMGPHDICDVMFFNDRTIVKDSKWLNNKGLCSNFVNSQTRTFPNQGRTKQLFQIITQAANDAFKELGNVGAKFEVPLHQTMIVLTDASVGGDVGSAAPTALKLHEFLTKGRFPEDNTTLPKTPLPTYCVWFPRKETEEFFQNARQFCENLANPEIGGGFFIVRDGQAAKGKRLAQAVQTRFDDMYILKWRVPCVSPTITQTFKLVFKSTDPPVAGDNCIDCPVGIDPTTWPLDIDYERTLAEAKKNPVHPGGELTVYGNFCWGSEHERAELYMIPKNQPAPQTLKGKTIEEAQTFQKNLIASGLRGKASTADNVHVVFEVPDNVKFLSGTGDKLEARAVILDSRAKRSSPVTAETILTVPARKKPFNILLIGGITFGGVVLLLLLIAVVRGGGRGRRRGATQPRPVVVGGAPPGAGPRPGAPMGPAPVNPSPMGGAPMGPGPMNPMGPGGPPMNPGGPPMNPGPMGPGPMGPGPMGPGPMGPVGPGPMGPGPMGPGPMGPGPMGPGPMGPGPMGPGPAFPPVAGPAPGGMARQATLHGTPGVYPVGEGRELKVGRDPGVCDICLTEPRVSGLHASVKFEGGQLQVRDEGSNNGTYLNGARLSSYVWQPVPPGAQVRFGPIEFTVRLE